MRNLKTNKEIKVVKWIVGTVSAILSGALTIVFKLLLLPIIIVIIWVYALLKLDKKQEELDKK